MAEKFEEKIKVVTKELMRQGVAFIEYRPVMHIMVKGRGMYAQKSPYDFYGCLMGGRHVCFEAKNIMSPRLAISKHGDFKLHQLIALQDIERLKGLSFLLWKRDKKILMIKPSEVFEYFPKEKSIAWDNFGEDRKFDNLNFLYPILGGKVPCRG